MSDRALVISSAASEEVAQSAAHIAAESSQEAALRWLAELEALFRAIQEMPERFAVAREDPYFPHGTLRRALHHNHRVLFTADERTVLILHVRHGMRRDLTDF